jgi:Domain of unknown function (DUF4192)
MRRSTSRGGTFTVRSPADVLALIPYTFGFHPEDSLVLLALGDSGRPFQARIDLPADVADLPVIVDRLVGPAVANRAERAILVAYCEDECLASVGLRRLEDGLAAAGIATVLAFRADGSRWFPVERGAEVADGVPYDVRTHELTSESVLDGRVTFRSRQELASSLTVQDPEEAERLRAAHDRLPAVRAGDRFTSAVESRWLARTVRQHVAAGRPFDVDVGARVLRAIAVAAVREHAWCAMTREDAESHIRLWTDLVRRCDGDVVAPAAAVLGFAAWLNGNGALAWCAVDRALCADPDHSMARLVADLLDGAMPPSTWRPYAAVDVAALQPTDPGVRPGFVPPGCP